MAENEVLTHEAENCIQYCHLEPQSARAQFRVIRGCALSLIITVDRPTLQIQLGNTRKWEMEIIRRGGGNRTIKIKPILQETKAKRNVNAHALTLLTSRVCRVFFGETRTKGN